MTEPRPDVSVVVPAFNAATTIEEQLEALRTQETTRTFEVIVADNGSTDDTRDVVRNFAASWPDLRLIDASGRRGSAHARNQGASASLGEALAFCDADDVVEEGWLDALVAPLARNRIVFGTLRVDAINKPHVTKWRATPHTVSLADAATPRSFAPSGNMAISRTTYLDLGGMDEDYPKAHDVEFSFRARAAGVELHPAPEAVVHYRYRATLRGAFHQGFRSGRASTQLWAQFRHESSNRTAAMTVRSYWWLLTRAPFLLSRRRQGLWVSSLGNICGHLVGSIKYRVWYL